MAPVVWKHIIEDLHYILHNLNNLRTSYKFTVETEVDGQFRFLDVQLWRRKALKQLQYIGNLVAQEDTFLQFWWSYAREARSDSEFSW
jgi:hypothetical protein